MVSTATLKSSMKMAKSVAVGYRACWCKRCRGICRLSATKVIRFTRCVCGSVAQSHLSR
ncbi:Uncharacterised protein [Vibrio cholerae]|nr:Uncharacterised protein [Vibrio cholerae]